MGLEKMKNSLNRKNSQRQNSMKQNQILRPWINRLYHLAFDVRPRFDLQLKNGNPAACARFNGFFTGVPKQT